MATLSAGKTQKRDRYRQLHLLWADADRRRRVLFYSDMSIFVLIKACDVCCYRALRHAHFRSTLTCFKLLMRSRLIANEYRERP